MRKCNICGDKYTPFYNTMQKTCGNIQCAIALGRKIIAKNAKEDDANFKRKFISKDRPHHVKKLQIEFNRFIQLRDRGLPCISCDTTKPVRYDAGHYLSVGSHPELRFEEMNCHRQCSNYCNLKNSGNSIPYRINLIKKIGIEKVEWLEGPHELNQLQIHDLKELRKHYKKKNLEMSEEIENMIE